MGIYEEIVEIIREIFKIGNQFPFTFVVHDKEALILKGNATAYSIRKFGSDGIIVNLSTTLNGKPLVIINSSYVNFSITSSATIREARMKQFVMSIILEMREIKES